MRLRHRNLKIVSIWATLILLLLAGGGWWFYNSRDARAYEIAAEAQMALQAGNLFEARTGFLEAISRKDDVPAFYLQLGRTNFQLGEMVAAYSAFNAAYSLDPDNPEAMLAVAQLGVQVGDIEASKEATRRLILRDSRFVPALVLQGVHNMLGRNYGDAIKNADEALAIDPANEEALILKIRATFLKGDAAGARSLLEENVASDTSNVGLAMTELEVYRELGDAERMSEIFGKLRQLQPDNREVLLDEAHLQYKLDNPERANEITIATLTDDEVEPEEISAAMRLLRLYADPVAIARSVPRLRREANEDTRIEMAKYLAENDQPSPAKILMEGVTGNEALTFEALLALDQGQPAKALAITNPILENDDSNCYAQFLRARAQLDTGKIQPAILSGQTAVTECPSLLEGWVMLARAYDRAGKDIQAERVFEQGIEFNPQEPTLARSYSDWLIAKKRPREAIAVARKIARLMPAYTPVWEDYAALCGKYSPACVAQAQTGIEESRKIYGLDPPPGERANAGLFGRFLIR